MATTQIPNESSRGNRMNEETPPSMYWDFDDTKYLEDGHPVLFQG